MSLTENFKNFNIFAKIVAMKNTQTAEVGIIGGSGFYKLLKKAGTVNIMTPYGKPASPISIGVIGTKKVAFLPRHGLKHQFPPHKIPYKANLWALKSLGVTKVISLTACGSLQKDIKRGDFVIIDQFIDRTTRQDSSFYNGPETVHISTAFPYCPVLSGLAYKTTKKMGIKTHSKGTLVVIEGPRFSTYAESAWFTKMGWDIINMTGHPEAALARELEICYCSIAIVTDYDAGISSKQKLPPVTLNEILDVFGRNVKKAQKLVTTLIHVLPDRYSCTCNQALKGAQL